MGVSAPAATTRDTTIDQATGSSPLINKGVKDSLAAHRFSNPTNGGQSSGTEADVQDVIADGDEELAGVGFTAYKINRTADGATPIDVTTNEGLLAASRLKTDELATGTQAIQALIGNGVLTKVAERKTNGDDKRNVGQGLVLGTYLVIEVGPKEGYDSAVPSIALVPMASNGEEDDETQGTIWNYDVYAFPKNYEDEKPTKTAKDKDQNAGDENLAYAITSTACQLGSETKRTRSEVTDEIDSKLGITKADVKIVKGDGSEQVLPTDDDKDGRFFEGNKVDVDLKPEVTEKLVTDDKVVVTIATKLKAEFKEATDIAPNAGLVFQSNPDGSKDSTPKETPEVKTYWGGL